MTWPVALRLGRVSNLPTVWTNVAAAAVLAAAPVNGAAVVAVAFACSLFYVGGMFLNDAFDREFDARARPERPIPAGLVSAREVFAYGFGLLGGGMLLAGLVARLVVGSATPGLVAGTALAMAIVVYDTWHKSNPAAPLLMGLCRVLVYIVTAATLVGSVPAAVSGGAAVLLLYLIGLTYTARFETVGAVRNVWPLMCLAAPFLFRIPVVRTGAFGTLLYVGALAWVLACLSHLGWRQRIDVPRAVVGMIAGIALVDALAISTSGSVGLALAATGGFALTLALQRWVPGT